MLSLMTANIQVLMVCLGNICRSPTAHGVFNNRIKNAGLADKIHVDCSGTGNYHIGEKPDRRSIETAAQRGYDLSSFRARQVQASDFGRFDYILAMDNANLRDLQARCPQAYLSKLQLFLDYAGADCEAVPDPYFSGAEGFDVVLDLIEDASDGLLAYIRDRHFPDPVGG
jgi:protein-tyrosine phosphatase